MLIGKYWENTLSQVAWEKDNKVNERCALYYGFSRLKEQWNQIIGNQPSSDSRTDSCFSFLID